MSLGYAILNSELKIQGNAKVTGNWNILFTNITPSVTGSAVNSSTPDINKTTAIFQPTLNNPGDKVEYTITISNNGNIPAIVDSISLTESDNSNVTYEVKGIVRGNVLNPSATQDIKLVVTYKNTGSDIVGTKTIALSVNYVQKYGSLIEEVEVPAEKNVLQFGDVTFDVVTTGDGLYADDAEEGRYIFKGESPLNNITFNGENWRILSIETDETIKIVKETSIGNMEWDVANNRNSTDTYCTIGYGCNAWAKTANLLDTTGHTPTEFKLYYPNGNSSSYTKIVAGSVTSTDASLNTYLNNDYFTNTLKTDKQYIVEHKFNVGTPGYHNDMDSVAANVEQEKYYQWVGKVGLITATEYMRATTNTTCTSLINVASDLSNCATNNWIRSIKGSSNSMWTLSPFVYPGSYYVWYVDKSGYLAGYLFSSSSVGIYPVVYLDSSILLSVSEKQDDKFEILGLK